MFSQSLYNHLSITLPEAGIDAAQKDAAFYARLIANAGEMEYLHRQIYGEEPRAQQEFLHLLHAIIAAYQARPAYLKELDNKKTERGTWYLSNKITGMSLYVDRFCGNLPNLEKKLGYFRELGVNLLHLMPLFESPPEESDGGYAVSDFRTVDPRFGDLNDLHRLREKMQAEGLYLMLDLVLNHSSHQHEWAQKAKAGDKRYQDYYYFFPDRSMPDQFEAGMPEIFPESAPGNFTWVPECRQWAMTVFHQYQWDLNYSNPEVLTEMSSLVFFYANLGVDVLRIDAPAFIWKKPGTTCQNLPEAHLLLRLIRLSVEISAPGMALLAEAIVSPGEIMRYFGNDRFRGRECHIAYNATHMALQWDALATGKTGVMLAAQEVLGQKPEGCTWINYTRCHDDIGLGYDDDMIRQAGYDPYEHRRFLKEYYSGHYYGSTASGALFSVNPKTQDARISGSLASLCGLETALALNQSQPVDMAVRKILLMQAHSFFLGGLPMIYYGDEIGYTNDYSYQQVKGKDYDNRWMHRPVIDWQKNERRKIPGSPEYRVFEGTRQLIALRASLPLLADHRNLEWLNSQNMHVAAFRRITANRRLYGLFNFSAAPAQVPKRLFSYAGQAERKLYDRLNKSEKTIPPDSDSLPLQPYEFLLLESRDEPWP